ncbi:uncharacterized protein RCC_06089 [Ramularia collo-cygni]|uniref:Uncharacterized protein n=1 Tax=Ramularia collo-cygni TaxID=112498 RepID=A0A2D3USD7_9PEZI|nr:uncharacterized protein RCC_06089 [Ramularia collo-cygni]CZT20232.1 uncharacterized protein RCC_06089 [Ramularia collo-cygni]
MLAAPSSSPHQYNPFLPTHSSPLARDARRATFNFAMNDSSNTTIHASSSHGAYTFGQQSNTDQRQNPKAAPKISTERLGRQRTGAFLRKVREGREERRWETRGEDIMRADFLSRQRAWEAAQARNAPAEDVVHYEDELEEGGRVSEAMEINTSQVAPEDEVDDFLRDEDQELEALLEFMPAGGERDDGMKDDGDSLWSDDADYEALFEQVLSQEQEGQIGSLDQQLSANDVMDSVGEEMDMS